MKEENLTILETKSIKEALAQLNQLKDISRLILFVKQTDGVILGSLTDGDIRRALIDTGDLDKNLSEICNRNFVYRDETSGFIDLSDYRKQGIKILPLLHEDHTLSRIIDLEKTDSILPLECMIMAGGRGKRLSPLTDTVPKPMLPLGGKPIIEYNIDRLISHGVKKIYISVKYLGEQIEDYFGDGSSKGIKIEYVWEEKALGTAGALALPKTFGTDKVLLMNSDLFTNVDFEQMYLKMTKEEADMVVASTEYKIDVPYAVLEEEDGRVQSFKEKPSYVFHSNAGIYILKTELIKKIPKNEFYDITDLMEKLVQDGGKLVHTSILGYWIDIGKPIDYKKAQEFVKHFD